MHSANETPTAAAVPLGVNAMIPNSARIMDYLLGGTDNFESDRKVADSAFLDWPGDPGGVAGVKTDLHAARDVLGRMVNHLVNVEGVTQFLDLASGLPTMGNTHLKARAADPTSKVVYSDNDISVASHGQYLLQDDPGLRFLDANFNAPKALLRRAAETLDFNQPIALFMFGVLHFVPDEADPADLVSRYVDALAPGSFVAVSHFAKDETDTKLNGMLTEMDRKTGDDVVRRTRAEVEKLLGGLELLDPGVVATEEWRPDTVHETKPMPMWCGLARTL